MTGHAADKDFLMKVGQEARDVVDAIFDAVTSGDYVQAVLTLRKLASEGNVIAQFNLAQMYHTGQHVTQDYAEAMMWYRKAADQGKLGSV
jgi:TPR repeat protein